MLLLPGIGVEYEVDSMLNVCSTFKFFHNFFWEVAPGAVGSGVTQIGGGVGGGVGGDGGVVVRLGWGFLFLDG